MAQIGAKPLGKRLQKDLRRNWKVYLMLLPVVAYFVLFAYMPMGGLLMGFENYRIKLGLLGSKWIGFENFRRFFSSLYFGILVMVDVLIKQLFATLFIDKFFDIAISIILFFTASCAFISNS